MTAYRVQINPDWPHAKYLETIEPAQQSEVAALECLQDALEKRYPGQWRVDSMSQAGQWKFLHIKGRGGDLCLGTVRKISTPREILEEEIKRLENVIATATASLAERRAQLAALPPDAHAAAPDGDGTRERR